MGYCISWIIVILVFIVILFGKDFVLSSFCLSEFIFSLFYYVCVFVNVFFYMFVFLEVMMCI